MATSQVDASHQAHFELGKLGQIMHSVESHPDLRRQELARQYARRVRWLSLAKLAVVGTVLLVLIFSDISTRFGNVLGLHQPWASALYFLVLAVGLGVVTMPLTYYQGFVLPRRYGLSSQKFSSWLADRAKVAALAIALGGVATVVVYWFLANFPDVWWLWAGILLALVSILLTQLTPILLLPLFFKLEPLADMKLKERLMKLAKKAGTRLADVVTIDLSSKSTAANAMLAGLGNTRRIIISDTLVQQYSPEEVEVIMAHELAHHLHRDIPKLIAVETVTIVLAFYAADWALRAGASWLGYTGIADVAAFPLLLLAVAAFGLVVTPLINGYSRGLEIAADETALALTGNPQAFVTAMTKLTDQNLTVADPGRWLELIFYDHPSYTRRVDLARRYCEETS